jgi:hypothetical protein
MVALQRQRPWQPRGVVVGRRGQPRINAHPRPALVGEERADILVEPLHPRLCLRRLALRIAPERLRQPVRLARIEPRRVAPVHERLLVAPRRLQRAREPKLERRIVRRLDERRLVARQRLGRPPKRRQRLAAIPQRLGVVRDQRQRRVLACQRLRGLAQALQRDAQVVVRFGALGVAFDRLAEQDDCLVRPVLLEPQQPEIA